MVIGLGGAVGWVMGWVLMQSISIEAIVSLPVRQWFRICCSIGGELDVPDRRYSLCMISQNVCALPLLWRRGRD